MVTDERLVSFRQVGTTSYERRQFAYWDIAAYRIDALAEEIRTQVGRWETDSDTEAVEKILEDLRHASLVALDRLRDCVCNKIQLVAQEEL